MNVRSPGPVRDAIRDAALAQFSVTGYHGTGLRDVARTAGFSVANLYNHFDGKSDLLVAVVLHHTEEQLRVVRRAVRRTDDPRTRLQAAVTAHVRHIADHLPAARVAHGETRYLDEADRRRVHAAWQSLRELYEEVIADGIAAGVFATPDAHEAALALGDLLRGLVMRRDVESRPSAAAMARTATHFALALVGATDADEGGTRG